MPRTLLQSKSSEAEMQIRSINSRLAADRRLTVSINRVGQHPLSQLLDTESKLIFEIPKYQREYIWGINQWENLFDDLMDNNPGYFLGTIICIDTGTDFLNPRREVVDGQQRLTTLSLLLAALYSRLAEHRDEMTEDQKSDLLQLKRKLVLKNDDSQIRVIPQAQNNNLEDYKALLADQEITSFYPMPKFAGNRRIRKAFEYFKKRISEELEDSALQNRSKALFEVLDKVNSAIIVMIEVSSHSDAYTLFESLNNRGTPLTAVDLIKNLLLAKLDVDGNRKLDDYYQLWQRLLEYLGDDYSVQERFFRHNYNAFRKAINKPFYRADDTKQYPLGLLATRSSLMGIYEKVIVRNPKRFLEIMIDNARIYSMIIMRNTEGLSERLQESYLNLSRVQGAPSYLILLYLNKHKELLDLTENILSEIVELLVSFFVRRNLTDTPPTRDLTRIFMALIDQIDEKRLTGRDILHEIRDELLASSASDETFESKLRGPVYDDNADATRFILCMLAKNGMTEESHVDLWRTTASKQFVWTIEHIFPQGEVIPEKWVEMIADGDNKRAKEYQSLYVHTLGNLTITGYNSTLGNKAFDEKRDRKDSAGREIGYRNGLNLNKDVVSEDNWTIDHIKNRTCRMIPEIISLFRMS